MVNILFSLNKLIIHLLELTFCLFMYLFICCFCFCFFVFLFVFFPFFYSQLNHMVGRHGRVGHHVMTIAIVPVRGTATIQATHNLVVEM